MSVTEDDDTDGLVSVTSYEESWPVRYERESKQVSAALGDLVVAIEHIGSTSVPGLTAKPTIDILVGVRKLEITEQAMARMAGLGYQHRGEMGIPGRRYFRKGDRYSRDFNVHVVLWGRDRSGMTMWPSATTCAPTRSGRSSTPNSNANY